LPCKALAGLAGVLVAVSFFGCGGSHDDNATSPSLSTVEAGGTESLNGLKRKARALQAERRRRSGDEQGSAAPGPNDPSAHSDSGGGAGQFRGEGDNSIQEFGHEASGGERESAAAALHAYLDAWAARRWKQACFYMSAGVAVTLERMASLARQGAQGGACPQLFASLNRGADVKAVAAAAGAVDVGSLRVKGERGFVLYHGVAGADYAMPMVREPAGWKVGAVEGIPLQ
jgi:hypothetical protein